MRSLFRFLCCSLLIITVVMTGLVQESAAQALRAAQHTGFGRMVFDWNGRVDYTATIVDGRLVVRFDRELTGDLRPILNQLPSYVRGGTISEDRRSVTFSLTEPFTLQASRNGNAVVLDLRQTGYATAPAARLASPPPPVGAPNPTVQPIPPAAVASPSVAPAPAPPSATSPRPAVQTPPSREILMRTGRHVGYSRLVFDWPSVIPYTVDQSGSAVTVTFQRAARINTRAARSLPDDIKFGDVSTGANETTVQLTIPADARARHSRVGSKIVVDIVYPAGGSAAQRSEGTRVPLASAPGQDVQPPAVNSAPVAPVAEVPVVPTAPVSESAPSSPVESVQPPLESTGGLAGDGPFAGIRTPDRSAPAVEGRSLENMPPPLTAPTLPPRDSSPVQPQVQTSSSQPDSATSQPDAEFRVGEVPDDGAARLVFEGSTSSGLAMFRRAGWLWLVFDQAPAVDLERLRASAPDIIQQIEPVRVEGGGPGMALRLIVDPAYNPVAYHQGANWIVTLPEAELRPASPIVVRSRSEGLSRLILTTGLGPRLVTITDPEVGDLLRVVTLPTPGMGIPYTYSLTDVTLLPTAQGAVIVPLTDGVIISARDDEVDITLTELGLRLSSPELRGEGENAPVQVMSDGSMLDIPLWYGTMPFEREHRLLRSVMDSLALQEPPAPLEERTTVRYGLARHLLAHGRDAETLAWLNRLEAEDPAQVDTPEFRVLRGAANYLMQRYPEAVEDLSHPGLKDDVSSQMWLVLAKAKAMPVTLQRGDIDERSADVLHAYPRNFMLRLGQDAVDVAVDLRDEDTAQKLMNMLNDVERWGAEERARLAYSQGRLQELKSYSDPDYVERASESYRQAEAGENRRYRALAGRARIDLELRNDKITLAEAIEGYERLRFGWRGGDFEFSLLKRLGEMQLASGDYPNGLRTLRELVSGFGAQPEIGDVMKTMRDAFAELYLDGAADRLKPLTAIALYNEFQELLPTGEKGDLLIQKLADRMVAVDLLDQAADLLNQQVSNRLTGVEKGRVGTRLALIQVLNHRPEQALAVLDASEISDLSLDLLGQRRRLRARALAELERYDESLALLNGDDTRDADVLRSEIFWKNGNWAQAADALGAIVSADVKNDDSIDDATAGLITDWVSALTLANNEEGVARLRRLYGERMMQTAYRDEFLLLTSENEEGILDYTSVPAKIKQVEDFRSSYLNKLRIEGLSSTIN